MDAAPKLASASAIVLILSPARSTALRASARMIEDHYEAIVAAMRAGHAIVVSDEFLDWAIDRVADVRSAFNRRRLGVRDEFVAWIGEQNQPSDITWSDGGWAHASGLYMSELSKLPLNH